MAALDLDYYSIVGVSATADSNEITSAYRKASLKVHPDRNPDDPLAAEKFHALKTAFEVLLDPIKRSAFDAKRSAQVARDARFASLDNKRKALARDLEAREEAFLKSQAESLEKASKVRKLDEIKAAGARLRQAKMTQLASVGEPRSSATPPSSTYSNEPNDAICCNLRFKWVKRKIPELVTGEDLSTRICSSEVIKTSDIESVLISSKGSATEEVSKRGLAIVCFKSNALCDRFFEFTQTNPSWKNCTVTRIR